MLDLFDEIFQENTCEEKIPSKLYRIYSERRCKNQPKWLISFEDGTTKKLCTRHKNDLVNNGLAGIQKIEPITERHEKRKGK